MLYLRSWPKMRRDQSCISRKSTYKGSRKRRKERDSRRKMNEAYNPQTDLFLPHSNIIMQNRGTALG
jgi:hypothetical protein